MTIVEELKKKIKESGGSTAGVNDIKDAVKALDSVGGGNSPCSIEYIDFLHAVVDENTIVIEAPASTQQ